MAPNIAYCTTYDDVLHAASTLSRFPVLIVDCEGHNLGMPDGALSILTISDSLAENVFLIDVLALPTATDPSLAALLALLSDASVTKVFWDGRGDALELAAAYRGLRIAGVLDLQLVEVASRKASGRETDAMRLSDFKRGYFWRLQQDIQSNPSSFNGIHRLGGLAHVVRLLGLETGGAGKDPAVVAMHKAQGSEIWMRRPLPHRLLNYAGHDAVLIAQLYARLMQEPWIRSDGTLEQLKTLSARYIDMFPTRALLKKHQDLDLKRFLPLGFLDDYVMGSRQYYEL
ncbi:ribonuclease H-like domain-containing protein [Trametes punicea]|nr:ribonuclease H-like domain-containing protein [Trametes punicea]